MRPTENQLRSFDDWYNSDDYHQYAEHWNEQSQDIMKHAWMIYMNVAWVNSMFNQCNQIEVLKHIIKKCKMYIRDINRFSEDDEWCIKKIYDASRREMYRRLMLYIDEYCLDIND